MIFPVLISVFTTNTAFADCKIDKDWDEKPCLDMPPYPKTTLVQMWEEYHSLKGQTWMEDKKAEMYYAIEKGILQEWLSYGTQYQDYQNYNVHFYYFLYGEAPAVGSYQESIIRDEDHNRDIIQYSESGKDPYEIIITYYYISTNAMLLMVLFIAAASATGFFWIRRTVTK